MAYNQYEKELVLNGIPKRYEIQILNDSDAQIDLITSDRLDYESAEMVRNLSSSDQKFEFGLSMSAYFKCTFHYLAENLIESDYTNKKVIVTQKIDYIDLSDVPQTASELIGTFQCYYVKLINKKNNQYEFMAYDKLFFEQYEDINLTPVMTRTDSLFPFVIRDKMGGLKNGGVTTRTQTITRTLGTYSIKYVRTYIECNNATDFSHLTTVFNPTNQTALNNYVPSGFKTANPNFFKTTIEIYTDDNYTYKSEAYYMDSKNGVGEFSSVNGSIRIFLPSYIYYIYPTGGTATALNKSIVGSWDTYLTNRALGLLLDEQDAITVSVGTNGKSINQRDFIDGFAKWRFFNFCVDRNGNFVRKVLYTKRFGEVFLSENLLPSETLEPTETLTPQVEVSMIRSCDIKMCDIGERIKTASSLNFETSSDSLLATNFIETVPNQNDFFMDKKTSNPFFSITNVGMAPLGEEPKLYEPNAFIDSCFVDQLGDQIVLPLSPFDYKTLLYNFMRYFTYQNAKIESVSMPWLELGDFVSVDNVDQSVTVLVVKNEIKGISVAQTQTITSM